MKTKTLMRSFPIVTEDPDEFKEKFDAALEELSDKDPQIEVDLSDEFHAEGLRFLCMHCPHYEDPGNKTVKHVACKYADLGRTHLEHEACEVFYKQVKNGTVQPKEDPIPLRKMKVPHGTGWRWV